MLMFIPTSLKKPDSILYMRDVYKMLSCEMFNKVVGEFQDQLRTAKKEDKGRPTLQKQVSTDTSTYNVLRQDQPYVLSLLDKAIAAVGADSLIKPVLFLSIFGHKSEDEFDLFEVMNPFEVESMSVHAA